MPLPMSMLKFEMVWKPQDQMFANNFNSEVRIRSPEKKEDHLSSLKRGFSAEQRWCCDHHLRVSHKTKAGAQQSFSIGYGSFHWQWNIVDQDQRDVFFNVASSLVDQLHPNGPWDLQLLLVGALLLLQRHLPRLWQDLHGGPAAQCHGRGKTWEDLNSMGGLRRAVCFAQLRKIRWNKCFKMSRELNVHHEVKWCCSIAYADISAEGRANRYNMLRPPAYYGSRCKEHFMILWPHYE